MHQDFKVRGFRGLQDLTLSDMSPVTIITGFNNVGKTSLLESLFIHACGPKTLNAMHLLGAIRGRLAVMQPMELLTAGTPWSWYFPYRDTAEPILLSATDTTGIVTEVRLHTSQGGSGTFIDGGADRTDSSASGGSRSLLVDVYDGTSHQQYTTTLSLTNTPFGTQGSQQTEPVPKAPLLVAHFLSDRIRLSHADLANAFSTLTVRGRTSPLLEALQAIDGRVQGLQILTEAFGSELHSVILDDGVERFIPLSLAGDGLTLLAEYLAALLLAENGIVVIDEFAAEVHYSRLVGAWSAVGSMSEELNTQVIVTTHSRECILAAEEAFAERPELMCLYRLVRDADGTVEAIRYDYATLRGALELGLDVR